MEQIKKAVKRNQWRFYTKINYRLEVEARFVMKGIENMLVAQKKKGISANKLTVASIIDQDDHFNGKKVDKAFESLAATATDEDPLLTEVKRGYLDTIEYLKQLDKEKRFFALETVNFFKGKLSIGKFVELLLLRKSTETLKFAAYQLIHHFTQFSYIIDDFNQSHVEKRELVLIRNFREELARSLFQLFSDQWQIDLQKQQGRKRLSCVQILRDLVDEEGEDKIKKKIRNDDREIIRSIADYLLALQKDQSLPVLGKARYKYYISFLGNLTEARQAPLNKIILGCLLQNRQYSPPASIIKILEHNDITEKTLRTFMAYLFNLTPSVLDKTIQRIGSIFETIEGGLGKPDYLRNIQYLSEEYGVPRQIEEIFLDLVRTGLLDLNVSTISGLHEIISSINVKNNQKKGQVIKDLFIPGNVSPGVKADQIETVEDLLLISDDDLTNILGAFIGLFGPESILILMLQKLPQELKAKIINSFSPANAKDVYSRLSMCLNCKYLNEHMIHENNRFKDILETLFLSAEDPLFCGYKKRGAENSSCFHEPMISGYQKAFLKQANQYLNDYRINVKAMVQ